MYLMDVGPRIMIYVGSNVSPALLKNVIGVSSINEIPDVCYDLQETKTIENERLQSFIDQLNEEKPFVTSVQIIRYFCYFY